MLDIESRALVSRMVEDGPNNVNWNTSWFERGAPVWTKHFSAIVFPADRWIWIQIGTECVMDVSTDDVEVDSVMDFKWFIKSVHITSSGDDA
ncbi:MAG: hypothetical protein AUG74_06370 [Bacteroidetes bacterium 13_1_20CM_4_60_6]|nr:MAG: hypothetical protein AUG74_06370 [Bacteroidetes bacterium 13_1_20CM_4_60_6]